MRIYPLVTTTQSNEQNQFYCVFKEIRLCAQLCTPYLNGSLSNLPSCEASCSKKPIPSGSLLLQTTFSDCRPYIVHNCMYYYEIRKRSPSQPTKRDFFTLLSVNSGLRITSLVAATLGKVHGDVFWPVVKSIISCGVCG